MFIHTIQTKSGPQGPDDQGWIVKSVLLTPPPPPPPVYV